MPSLFVSHGAPTLAVEDGPAHRFLSACRRDLGKPAAILVASAHWETETPILGTAETPATIHDFHGFPEPLYEIAYAAPGAPAVAERAAALLRGHGLNPATDASRGLDHGAWVPLLLMYPDADVPVAQISIETHLGPGHQLEVGRVLAPLRDEGVLIVGSGSLTHNLAEWRSHGDGDPAPDWVTEFADWVFETVIHGRIDDLVAYRTLGPHAVRNHPTEEHFLPLLTAAGAGGPEARPERLHTSNTGGVLMMDVYAFH